MIIKKKTLFLILFIAILILSEFIIYLSFETLQKNFFLKQCHLVENFLYNELDKQMQTTIDWAQWDDTVNFVEYKENDFIISNIDENTLKNIGINFMIFFDKLRSPFYSYFSNNQKLTENEKEVFSLKFQTKFFHYLSTPDNLKKIKTFAKFDNKFYMLTFYPILKNSGNPPAYGTLVFGKEINNNFLNTFTKIFKYKIKLIKNFYKKDKKIELKNFNGFIPIKDINNKTVFLVEISFNQSKSFQILKFVIFSTILFIIFIVVFFMKFTSKQEQIRIKSELDLLYQAIEHSKTGIILTEFNSNIFYVNNIVCEITKFTKDELYGKSATVLLDEKILTKIFTTGLKNKGFWKGEIFGNTKDGEKIDLEINISPVFEPNNSNRIRCFITTCEFISDKKRMIKELEKAKKESEEFNKMKSSILLNLSHEIKTPLTGIQGFIELLEETDLTDSQKEYLNYLKNSSERLTKLLTNFVELAKLEANLYSIKNYPFSIESFNNILIKKFKPIANQKGLTFKYFMDATLPSMVIGPEELLNKAISLVMDNAIKFTEHGEILYKCEMLEIKNDKIKVCFTIKDTGIGIQKEHFEKVFTSFTQVDTSTTRKFEGMGIGLALAKKYINSISGEIYLSSEKNKGTELKIIVNFDIKK